MLKRKIETYLAEWKEAKDRKPLVIKGIRQCGKTYIVQKFAKENYESVVYMNFILEPDKKSAFTGNICRYYHTQPLGFDSRQSFHQRKDLHYP